MSTPKESARHLADHLTWVLDDPDFDEAITLVRRDRMPGVLALSAKSITHRRALSPEVVKVLDEQIADTDHPPRYLNYLHAEGALRRVFTIAGTGGDHRVLDRAGFLDALTEWCDRVGYPMPAADAG